MTTQAIGASLPRAGGEGRVTGAQEYVADIRLTNVLQAKLVTIDAIACTPPRHASSHTLVRSAAVKSSALGSIP